jgi:hypothetical protein
MLFPQSINEYIPQDAPVRAYDAFVDALDFKELGIEMDAHKVGCPQYDPKAVLKLLLSECDAACARRGLRGNIKYQKSNRKMTYQNPKSVVLPEPGATPNL